MSTASSTTWGFKSAIAKLRGSHSLPDSPKVLAILRDPEIEQEIRNVAGPLGWRLTLSTGPGALELLRVDQFALAVVDKSALNENWREIIAAISRSRGRPVVLLLSQRADHNLWEEVARCGVYDVLGLPVRQGALASSLRRAIRFWRTQEDLRHAPQ
jgi:DNA-binding NtrC family response regulator